MKLNNLERRIIELSFKNKLSHISSCLNTVNLLDRIYKMRDKDDPVILGNSHAAVALYVVLEANGYCDAQKMIEKHGVHAGRDMEHGIWCSGGSLGQGETIAVGFALADPKRMVWLVTSDGSMMEGSSAEAMRTADRYCENLNIYCIYNGRGAYGDILPWEMPEAKRMIFERVDEKRYPEFLRGLDGHYVTMNQAQYEEAVVS